MLPVLLLGGVALWALTHKKKATASAPVTPAQAQVHGELMRREYRPAVLERAAQKFGEDGHVVQAKQLAAKADQVKQQARGAAELVERARAGDQNAMGMIAVIRDQALRGVTRACISAKLIETYCITKPAAPRGPTGEPTGWPPANPEARGPFSWPPPWAPPSTPIPG